MEGSIAEGGKRKNGETQKRKNEEEGARRGGQAP
jgi:hypothetical protein